MAVLPIAAVLCCAVVCTTRPSVILRLWQADRPRLSPASALSLPTQVVNSVLDPTRDLLGRPKAYWDDWMRLEKTRHGRACVRPEVCRTYNFGESGSSKGQFYYRYLVPIKLNDVDVPWTKLVRSISIPAGCVPHESVCWCYSARAHLI